MTDYLTTDTDLAAVADAIREKGGTSYPLTYPDGFVSAIEAIPTGGSTQPVTYSTVTRLYAVMQNDTSTRPTELIVGQLVYLATEDTLKNGLTVTNLTTSQTVAYTQYTSSPRVYVFEMPDAPISIYCN